MFSKIVRIFAFLLVGLLVLGAGAAGAVYLISNNRINKTYAVQGKAVAVPTDAAAIARGQHLASAIGKCVECHGGNLAGKVWLEIPKLGRYVGRNLTTTRGRLSDADLERAIRHGIGSDNRSLLFMPSEDFQYFSDQDLGALIAYIRSLKPIENALPPSYVGPLGRALMVAGQFPVIAADNVNHELKPSAPPAAVTPEYGAYLANIGGCTGCHGPGLSGGQVPGTPPDDPQFPPAANLTPTGIGAWSEADFFKALRTGIRPDGRQLNIFMPWPLAGQMTDDEIKAVWAFLQTVPPKPTGNR